jgi:hypothetical protein
MPRGGAFILSDIRGPTLSIVPDGWCRRIADVADRDLGRLNWADLCRSRAMLEGRIGQDTCRPRRLKVTAGSRVPAAKASDNVFVAIYTITLSIR